MKILISAAQIQQRLTEMAAQIAGDLGHQPVTIIGVLTGSLMFVADLIRHLQMPLKLGFIQASSYRGQTTRPGELEVFQGLLPDLRGHHVLLLDDILDTGQTLNHLRKLFLALEVASLRIGVLLKKTGRQQYELVPDYCGFEIPDEFVVGFGLDYNDEYRNLPHIAILDPARISAH